MPDVLPDYLGRTVPPQELVDACEKIVDAVNRIYALPNLDEQNRTWALRREAIARIILAYVDASTHHARLSVISDELDRRGPVSLAKITEEHVLKIGITLATHQGSNALNISVQALAERMVMFAEQHPGRESSELIDHFLQQVRLMSASDQDRRLAIITPVFFDHFIKNHQATRASALVGASSALARASRQEVVKQVIRLEGNVQNLLQKDRFRPHGSGFQFEDGIYVCDNGEAANVTRGILQTVTLNQTRPEPIVAEAWSRAENVSGAPSNNYSLYVDITYTDGTNLWGQTAVFPTGTHDWNKRTLTIMPQKPVRSLTLYGMFRNRSGRVYFRDMKLVTFTMPDNATVFDSNVHVVQQKHAKLQIRDIAANSDFIELRGHSLDIVSTVKNEGQITQVTLANPYNEDRCLTLVYAIPVPSEGLIWCEHPRSDVTVEPNTEYTLTHSISNVGSNGRLSQYPFAAVAGEQGGFGVGIDMKTPAFFRTGYHSGTGELYVVVDLALTKEVPMATINFVNFSFDPNHKFRGALDAYYRLFPSYFASRTPEQGLWIPFQTPAHIPNWEDFGIKFFWGATTEPNLAWANANNLLSFRYAFEPLSETRQIPQELPATYTGGLEYAHQQAALGTPWAVQLLCSGMLDQAGNLVHRLDSGLPWSARGIRWFYAPGINDGYLSRVWSQELIERIYHRPVPRVDGAAIDSTDISDMRLDFRRENFSASRTPLVFCQLTHRPLMFGALMTFEVLREVAENMWELDRLMMANYAPNQICFLVPWFDVLGQETNWHRLINGVWTWSPMSDSALLYRRALSGSKPYGFLTNTNFSEWTYELSELYMKRCLAYGMFPSFFSQDAATNRYFDNPDWYERDRPLFQKYVPLCKLVAEAGWQPITLATSSDPKVYIERFGTDYFTVFNDSQENRTMTLRFENPYTAFKDLVNGKTVAVNNGVLTLTLPPEAVALLILE